MINRTELRRKIICDVALKHGVTLDDLRGRRRTSELMDARIDAATQLSVAGFPATRIGQLLRRDHTVILYYLKCSNSGARKLRNMPVAVKSLPQEAREAIIEIARCQQTTPAMIVTEWLTERAMYEVEAKQRFVGNCLPIPSRTDDAAVCEAA
jgi:hypothetical protein